MGTPAFTGPEMSTDAKASGHLACIRNMANFNKFFGGHGLVIIDELDVVSTNAQYKLREIMQSGGRQVQFVFTTNHPQKVYTGIRSACRVIQFPHPTPQQWLPRAQHILQSEGVFLPDANVLNILAVGSGDIRQTCRLLQDTVLANLKSSAPASVPAVSLIPPNMPVGQPTP
jgi:DNA polymerase III delta prime subunit